MRNNEQTATGVN